MLVDIVPIGQVHAATLAQSHEVDHAVLAEGRQPASAHVAIGCVSQQQGNVLFRIVLYAPYANNAGVGVHVHHLGETDSLTSCQIQDVARQLGPIVVVVYVIGHIE